MNVQSNRLIDIATRDVTCLLADATLGEAAHIMAQRRFSSIVVIDQARHPLGIVTERNILKAMHAGSPSSMPLGEAMSTPVIVMSGDTDSLDAYQTCLREGIRHLVLIDDAGVVSGVVSETDFRLHINLTALAGRRKIAAIAKRSGIALPPDTRLVQALNLMHTQRKSCVVVVVQEKPVGIVTERDVVRFYSGAQHWRDVTLGDAMVSPVLTISHSATTAQAAEQMVEHKVRHLVSIDENGHLAGILTEHDLTQAMVSSLSEERAGIEESFLRTLINTLPDLVWLKDADGVYLSCNVRFEQLYGVSALGILGKTDYDFVDQEQADSFLEHDRTAMLKGAPSVNEEWLTFATDGYRGLFETIKTPMRDNQGRLVGVLGVARDITERKHVEQQRENYMSLLNATIESMAEAILVVDLNNKWSLFNRNFLELWGIPQEIAESGDDLAALSYVIDRLDAPEKFLIKVQELYSAPDSSSFDAFSFKDGKFIERYSIPQRVAGKVVGRVWSFRDVTERKRAEESLRITASVFDTTQEGILITDADNRIIEVNPAFTKITGYERDEVLGNTPKMLGSGRQSPQFYAEMWQSLQEKKVWRGEIWNRRKSGEAYAELLSISVICDDTGKVQRHVGVFSDITYFKDHEAELSRVANYDALTGIPNRRLLADRLAQAIAHVQRNDKMLAICYLDLDGFKEVNDRYGHKTGDDLLVEITRRLQEELRAGDTLARLGGDEFVLLLNDLAQDAECFQILERLMQNISTPVQWDGQWIAVSASIGVAFYQVDGESGDTLLRHADQAMYVAKQAGKNRIHCHRQR